ncbi:MAG: hypothetical protein P1R58_05850 [bacterium]|nr:hypothetical protein [bacterium]
MEKRQVVFVLSLVSVLIAIVGSGCGCNMSDKNVNREKLLMLLYPSHPAMRDLLDDAALDAAFLCIYKPGITNGKPIKVWVTYKVAFSRPEG